MSPFFVIARSACAELIRQPIFLILMASSTAFMILLGSVYYFALGEDPKLVTNSVLAVMLLTGLFGAVFNAASAVSEEIRSGAALTLLAKPVGRAQFLLAKYLGVGAALTLLAYANLLAALLASRMGFDVYGEPDYFAASVFYGALALGMGLAGASNFFFQRPFVKDAVIAATLLLTAAFVVINFFDENVRVQAFGAGVDWRVLPAGVLILFALWIFAAIAITLATRLDLIPTLAISCALFLLGLMSDYLFGRPAEDGAAWAQAVYAVVPNWQLFWVADALEGERSVPWSYVGNALIYVGGALAAALAVGLALFEDRELG